MPAVAATNPPVLIAHGRRRRPSGSGSGSGGVMLPNHAPLVVAEQFALLEAAYPGRIDLGIGRAPGSDPVTTLRAAARRRRGQRRGRHPLPRVRRQRAGHDGRRGRRPRRPGPRLPAAGDPGRHVGARHLAARAPRTTRPGWPPRRGCPTSSPTTSRARGTAEALELYRSSFRPSPEHRRAAHLPDRQRRRGETAGGGRAGSRCRSCWRCWRCAPGAAARRSGWSRRPRRSSCPSRTASLRRRDARALGDRLARARRGPGSPSSRRRTASTR